MKAHNIHFSAIFWQKVGILGAFSWFNWQSSTLNVFFMVKNGKIGDLLDLDFLGLASL